MISIIIPALNEEDSIDHTLERVSSLSGEKEIIVVDGGSTDDTQHLAEKYARVVESAPGRALQMNAGAEKAEGNVLLFIHADTIMPEDSLKKISQSCSDRNVAGGCFTAVFDSKGVLFRLGDFGRNLRSKIFRMGYGDQALFAKRSVFERVGGFPDQELMEDVEFYRRLRHEGRFVIIDGPVITSARRYLDNGLVKQWLTNQIIKTLYFFGTDPSRLRRIYERIR